MTSVFLSFFDVMLLFTLFFFFFFNDTATTEIYTLSLHDALPIFCRFTAERGFGVFIGEPYARMVRAITDRKSTRLNSSHQIISYAVFCLKKKKKQKSIIRI